MYFSGYEEAPNDAETTVPTFDRPLDVGGDVLPFVHLGDRRFEILAYRLKHTELNASGHRVTLMQGTGDQGRDVIVHSPSGKVVQIVQCKNYQTKFSAPDLRRELIKLALHNHLEPTILDVGPVEYELWCPLGLTKPAVAFLQTWPRSWNPAALAAEAAEVIESYVAFDGLDWAAIGQKVVDDFAKCVRPTHITDLIVTERVKLAPLIYETFFQGKVLLAREDALDALRARDDEFLKAMTQAMESGFAKLTDAHSKHVIDRIASFSPDKRLAHLSGYVMGLPADLVARFNRGVRGIHEKLNRSDERDDPYGDLGLRAARARTFDRLSVAC